MTDDLTPLQTRITTIVGDEERLNRNRKSAIDLKKGRRDVEKRSEVASLATLEKEKQSQMRVNEGKEQKFLADIKREGDELVNASKEVRDEYIAEVRHREIFKEKLQTKVTALEAKLRSIEGARP